MRHITVTIGHSETYIDTEENFTIGEEGLNIDFVIGMENIPLKENLFLIKRETPNLRWLSFEENDFYFDLAALKEDFADLFNTCSWMKGKVTTKPSTDTCIHTDKQIISFLFTKSDIEDSLPKKIFLSHKGANKPMVRKYFHLLKELGYEPWMDEDALVNGDPLDRGLLKGMKESCACVFFITPDFIDEAFLADEINYAKGEKRTKREKFQIITLQFKNELGRKGKLPELLEYEVYTTPDSDLDAFKDIIRSLPISLGKVKWRK